MVWWYYAIYYAAVLIIGELTRPKLSVTDARPTSADEANMPTASSTKSVSVVWGKCRLRDPNVVWYGDYLAAPIRKKAGKGGFLGTGHTIFQTVGYRYHWGQHLALCHGPVTLHRLWSEELEIWNGNSTGGEIIIDKENLYNGEDQGGGLAARINFLPGNSTQETDPYLLRMLTDVPAYRGVASLVWYGPSETIRYQPVQGQRPKTPKPSGYIGTSASPRPITAEVSRYPQQLNASESKIGDDCNPIELIYECLTTDPNGPDGWGMGLSPALLNAPAFQAAAHQCYTEGFGISLAWSSQTSIEDVIKEVCKTIDAVCFRDFKTGLWTIKLIRGGYNVDTLPVLDVSNIIELENYSQSGIDGTTNEVKVNYLDRSQNYKGMPAQAQDLANMRTQGEVISITLTFKGITTAALADRVANRELLALSTALAKADLIVNRTAYAFAPGDLFVLRWDPLGITQIVVRVVKSAIGLPNANRIRISVIQDIFQLGQSTFMVGGGTQWTDPIASPQPVTVQTLMEMPYFFNKDESTASYMVCAQRPNRGCATFEVWKKLRAEDEAAYQLLETCLAYTPVGELAATYGLTSGVDESGTMVLLGGSEVSLLGSSSSDAIRQGANLGFFDNGEFFAFRDFRPNQDGTFTLVGVWRGLFDTVPSVHPAGERVWFFTYGASSPDETTTQDAQINVKNLPFGPRGSVSLSAATALACTMSGRNKKPYPPGNVRLNGLDCASWPVQVDGTATLQWSNRNRVQQGVGGGLVAQDSDTSYPVEGHIQVEVLVNGVVVLTQATTNNIFLFTSSDLYNRATVLRGNVSFRITPINAAGSGTVRNVPSFDMIAKGSIIPPEWVLPPYVGGCTGLVMADTNTFIYPTSDRNDDPNRIISITSAGITHFSGSETGVSGFADGDRITARYHDVRRTVRDSLGNVFCIDNGNKIRKITPDGQASVFATFDTDVPTSEVRQLQSLTIDGNGNLYVFSNYRVALLKVTPGGAISTLADRTAFSGNQCEIASDASGNIFVKEYWGGVSHDGPMCYYTAATGVVTTITDGFGDSLGQMAVIGSDVYCLLCDAAAGHSAGLYKITPTGGITCLIGGAFAINWMQHLAADPGGFLAWSGYGPTVGRISSSGAKTTVYSYPQPTP